MKYRAVLFDLNHTLMSIRNEADIQEAAIGVLYSEVCRRTRVSIDETEFRLAYDKAWLSRKISSYRTYIEVSYEEIVTAALSEFGIVFDSEALEDILQIYMQPIYDASYVVDGMVGVLSRLKTAGLKLGLLTNYKYASGMRCLLEKNRLLEWFDAIVISSELGWKKPSTNIYARAVKLLSVDYDECIFVANEEEKDLWRASELGIMTILFTPVPRPDRDVLHDQDVAIMLRSHLTGHVAQRASSLRDLSETLSLLLSQ